MVGLGNPGRRYRGTLHNAGFAAVELLAEAAGVRMRASGEAETGAGELEGERILLVRPLSFMNLCGLAVAPLYRRRAGSPEDLVVIHDDLDLGPGAVRLKRGGGTGGHNGLRSLEKELGTRAFLRVRIGIGRPPAGVDPADYVLGQPPEEARDLLPGAFAAAGEAVRDILRDGLDKAMTRWNARRAEPSPRPAGRETLLAPGGTSGGSKSRKEARDTDD